MTARMQEATGVEVHDAASAQALYRALYSSEDHDTLVDDSVIGHVVEVVARLTAQHEELSVVEALHPQPKVTQAKKHLRKPKKKGRVPTTAADVAHTPAAAVIAALQPATPTEAAADETA